MNREAAFGISGDGRRADAGGTGEEERIGRFVERRNRTGGLGRRRRRRGVVEMGGGRGGAGAHKTRGVVVGPRVVMGRETRHNGKMGEDEQRCGEAQCRVGLSWFVLASHDPVPPRLAELTAGLIRSRVIGTARRERTYCVRRWIQAQSRSGMPRSGSGTTTGPTERGRRRVFRLSKTGCRNGGGCAIHFSLLDKAIGFGAPSGER